MRKNRTGTGKRGLAVLILTVLLFTVSVLSAAASAADGRSSEWPRQMQEKIVEWKRTVEGGGQLLSGSLLDGAGGAGSDWIAFNISRMGMEDNQAAYLSRLKDVVEKIYQDMDDSLKRYRVSDMHRIAMTIEACGGDPTNFGTDPDGNSIDLIKDTVWNSLWGDPGNQGINGYIWALLTVDSKHYEEPADAEWTREKMVAAILSRQLAGGGFGLVKTDPSDVDLTSMAMTALAPYGNSDKTYTFESVVTGEQVTVTVDEAAEKAFAILTTLQADDGTMITYDERTSESTAWAMMALASWGRDPEDDEMFIKNGNTLLDGIEAFQLEDGGIVHSLDGEEGETVGNNMAGYQAVYGLEAVCRLREGKGRVFDLTDAPTVSEEEIEEAGASLPKLSEEEEKTGEEVQKDTSRRMVYMTAAVAAAVVLVVIIFLTLILRDRKKNRPQGLDSSAAEDSDWDNDDDDEW